MAEAVIQVDADAVIRHLHGAARDARGLRFAKAIGQRWLGWVGQNFRDEGTEKKWKPLAASTILARAHGGNAVLQNDGNLRQAFTVLAIAPGSVAVGAEVVKDGVDIAAVHEFGTGPYRIRPKSKKALAFPMAPGPFRPLKGGAHDGKPGIVTRGVNHPGLPQRKMLPSQKLADQLAQETAEAIFRAIAKRAEGKK